MSTTNKTIKLRDGRFLGYAEYGNPAGRPIFHFHGWPSSRLEAQLFSEVAERFDVRLIGVDRPGMGLSTFQPDRKITNWPDDVAVLADELGLEKFGVQGMSGGGPYAAVCAARLQDRINICGIIAGIGPIDMGTKGMMPMNRATFFAARWIPWLLIPALWAAMGRFSSDTAKMKESIAKTFRSLPDSDQIFMRDPDFLERLVIALCESFLQGSKGAAYDCKLYGRSWGFEPASIACDRVYLWHGQHDVNVPVSMARGVAEAIPACEARFYPDEGHLLMGHLDEIMTTMASAAK